MKDIKNLLKELTKFDAPSGRERELSLFIEKYLKENGFITEIDYFGNVAGRLKKENGKKLLLTAHIDQILFYVTKIDKNYILIDTRMADKKILKGKEVILITEKGKFKGIIGMTPPHIKAKEEKDYLYIDLGLLTSEETGVKPGDPVLFSSEFKELNENICAGRSFDNRASASVLLDLARELKDMNFKGEIILYFSVQEEISGLGASLITKKFEPHEAICLDVTFARAKLDEDTDIELNKGPVIAKGPFITGKISEKLIKIAKKEEIPFQIEVIESYTGTDLDNFFVRDGGVPSGLVSIPLRYMHSPNELLDVRDLLRTKKLLIYYIKEELS
ncbi:MAG: M20/M25/M40 family metallo-hydrolase [candidate division WOR-3 bacterium]